MNELKNKQLPAALALLGVVLAILIFYAGYSMYLGAQKSPSEVPQVEVRAKDFRSVLQESVSGTDPKPLQDFFAKQVKDGENTNETKSAIYWITHRYFDNGGDIYEIFNFVEAHPEVAFLKEAETLYPSIFADIKNKKVTNFSRDSLLALLSYYEVIDRKGYGDIALWGIAANKYAELAQSAQRMHELDPEHVYEEGTPSLLKYRSEMIDRSMHFVRRVQDFFAAHTLTTGRLEDLLGIEMIPDDLLVGLNQYGAAIENLKFVGMVIHTPFEPGEIYIFNEALAKEKVPRLYFFTNYLYASSLVYGKDATVESVALPLARIVEYAETTSPAEWRNSVTRVITAKDTRETGGMYGYPAVKTLASLSPEFKNWLMKQGWTEADFK